LHSLTNKSKLAALALILLLSGCATGKFNTSHVSTPSTEPQTEINLLINIGEEKNKYTTRGYANRDLVQFSKALEKKLIKNSIRVEVKDLSSGDKEKNEKPFSNAYRYTLVLSWSHYSKNSQGGAQLTAAFNLIDNNTKKSLWKSNTTFPVNAFSLPKVSNDLISELVTLKFLKLK